MKKLVMILIFSISLCLIPISEKAVETEGTFTPVFANYAPVQSNQLIWNGITEKTLNATDVNVSSVSINLTITDANGNLMDWYCYLNISGTWMIVDYEIDANNGSKSTTNVSWFMPVTNYSISFNLTDHFLWDNRTFWFETDYSVPTLTDESPVNGSIVTVRDVDWHINITDFTPFNWSIECSTGANISNTSSTNGTYYLNMTNLPDCTTYTIWVNVTNGNKTVNNSYLFSVILPTIPGAGGGGYIPPVSVPEEKPSVPAEVEEGIRLSVGMMILIVAIFFILILWKRRKKDKEKSSS